MDLHNLLDEDVSWPSTSPNDDHTSSATLTIQEGLLCPVCRMDFRTITQLCMHAQKEHNIVLPAKTQTFIALPSLLGEDEDSISDPVLHNDSQPMLMPATRSQMTFFSSERELVNERFESETNKLLIRLSKILKDYPALENVEARKKHEQQVVPWIDNKLVSRCPICAKNICRFAGRHHCRLCGMIMCQQCSVFISFEWAQSLTNAATSQNSIVAVPQQSVSTPNKTLAKPRLSLTSLDQLKTRLYLEINGDFDNSNLDKIRLCIHCHHLVWLRKEKIDARTGMPLLVKLHEQFSIKKKEVMQMLSTYQQMAVSLRRGKSDYKLSEAEHMISQIKEAGLQINHISKSIESLGQFDISHNESVISNQQLEIQANIRFAAVLFIQRYCLSFEPPLPGPEEYAKLQSQYEERLRRRIVHEKEIELYEQKVLSNQKLTSNISSTQIAHSGIQQQQVFAQIGRHENGHVFPVPRHKINTDDHPLAQQMAILQHMITQAYAEHRWDDLSSLEQSLKDIEIEYEKRFDTQKDLLSAVEASQLLQLPLPSTIALKDNECYPSELDPFADNEDGDAIHTGSTIHDTPSEEKFNLIKSVIDRQTNMNQFANKSQVLTTAQKTDVILFGNVEDTIVYDPHLNPFIDDDTNNNNNNDSWLNLFNDSSSSQNPFLFDQNHQYPDDLNPFV